MLRKAAATAALLALLLGGCAGVGPGRSGLGAVVANIAVTDGKGATCSVSVTNGQDQTGLTLKGLHVCGGSLDELHADKSDGAAAAIAANEAVANHAIDVGGSLAQTGIAAATGGIPLPKPPKPPVVVPPAPQAAADQRLAPGLHLGPNGHRRTVIDQPSPGSVRYRSEGDTVRVVGLTDWLAWVRP